MICIISVSYTHLRITGLTEVGDVIPIKMYVDRDYPDYQFPVDLRSKNDGVDLPTFLNLSLIHI